MNRWHAHPEFVKAHPEPHDPHGKEGQRGHENNIAELLLRVRVQREQRVWVLGEVVVAVKLPQAANVVHRAVIPVEEEVDNNRVHPNLQRQHRPVDRRRRLAASVREADHD